MYVKRAKFRANSSACILLKSGIMEHHLWHGRLIEAINAYQAEQRRLGKRDSDRDLSKAAGLGPNYVGQIRSSAANVGVETMLKLCKQLDVSVTYIMTGARLTREEEDVVKMFSRVPPEAKAHFLGVLRSLQPGGEAPE